MIREVIENIHHLALQVIYHALFYGLINCKHRYDPNLPLKEDYDFCIQICNDERQILRFNQYSLTKERPWQYWWLC